MRFRVRKIAAEYEVWVIGEGWPKAKWVFSVAFPTWWQAMLHVTGDLPYGSETEWTPSLRPLWVN